MQNVIVIPTSYTRVGEYSATLRSGTMAAGLASDSEIVHVRWTPSAGQPALCIVTEFSIWAGTLDTGFTAGGFLFRLAQVRGWTGVGTGGGTATLTGNNGKLRTDYPTTAMGSGLRGASTVALGVGTKTSDANGLAELGGGVGTAAGAPLISPNGYFIGGGTTRGPVVLANQEGLVLTAVVPATGTWRFGVSIRWEETSGYPK